MRVGLYIVLFLQLIAYAYGAGCGDKYFKAERTDYSDSELALIFKSNAQNLLLLYQNKSLNLIAERYLKSRLTKQTADGITDDLAQLTTNLLLDENLEFGQILATRLVLIQKIEFIQKMLSGYNTKTIASFLEKKFRELQNSKSQEVALITPELKSDYIKDFFQLMRLPFEEICNSLFQLDDASNIQDVPLAFAPQAISSNPFFKILASEPYIAAIQIQYTHSRLPTLLTTLDLENMGSDDAVLTDFLRVEFILEDSISEVDLLEFKQAFKDLKLPIFKNLNTDTYFTYFPPQKIGEIYRLPFIRKLKFYKDTHTKKVRYLLSFRSFE